MQGRCRRGCKNALFKIYDNTPGNFGSKLVGTLSYQSFILALKPVILADVFFLLNLYTNYHFNFRFCEVSKITKISAHEIYGFYSICPLLISYVAADMQSQAIYKSGMNKKFIIHRNYTLCTIKVHYIINSNRLEDKSLELQTNKRIKTVFIKYQCETNMR